MAGTAVVRHGIMAPMTDQRDVTSGSDPVRDDPATGQDVDIDNDSDHADDHPEHGPKGVLEDLGEAVETVFGDDHVEGAPRETRYERRQRLVETWTAIVLAIAAVATAWASYEASQWADKQADAQAGSAVARTEAARAATSAATHRLVDVQTWLDWVDAVGSGDAARAGFLEARFSDELDVAQAAWLAGTTVDAQGIPRPIPEGTPFELAEYVIPDLVRSEAYADEAEEQLAIASDASTIATQYVLVVVILAVTMFFASITTKVRYRKAQSLLIVVAIGVLGVGMWRLLILPDLF